MRDWGDCLKAHMDHAWLLMCSHAQVETRLHSGELGAVQVEGDADNVDACSGITGSSKGSKGKEVGQPRKAQKTGPTLPSVPVVPPAAQVADWLHQQQAQPQWQQRPVVAEGEVLQLKGKLQDSQQDT